MKYYYYAMAIVAGIIALYGFVVPFLVSYPSDFLSASGLIIGVGAIPVFIILIVKLFKQVSK